MSLWQSFIINPSILVRQQSIIILVKERGSRDTKTPATSTQLCLDYLQSVMFLIAFLKQQQDDPDGDEVKNLLWKGIVNPLRKYVLYLNYSPSSLCVQCSVSLQLLNQYHHQCFIQGVEKGGIPPQATCFPHQGIEKKLKIIVKMQQLTALDKLFVECFKKEMMKLLKKLVPFIQTSSFTPRTFLHLSAPPPYPHPNENFYMNPDSKAVLSQHKQECVGLSSLGCALIQS